MVLIFKPGPADVYTKDQVDAMVNQDEWYGIEHERNARR